MTCFLKLFSENQTKFLLLLDLPGIHQLNISKDSRRRKVSSAVSDLSDDYHSSTETPSLNHSGLHLNLGSRTASLESDSSCPLFVAGESKEKYLQTKSNCRFVLRVYNRLEISHLTCTIVKFNVSILAEARVSKSTIYLTRASL